MLITPSSDVQGALDDCVEETLNEISKRAANGYLAKMTRMAVIIEDEPEGTRKRKMMDIYDATEKEYIKWKMRICTG